MPAKVPELSPLTGVLDLRSSPDLMPAGSVRQRQNFQTVADGKLRRGTGWAKLLSGANYNNQDFHDQLLTFGGIRQPVTLLQEAQSSAGVRSLFAATQSKIARLSEHGGNWKLLGLGLGGEASTSAAASRFRCAQQGDYLVFVNDFDRPKYHILEQVGTDGESLYEFDDLVTIGVTRSKFVWVWRDMVIFANLEQDGRRYGYRIISSAVDNPTVFDPENVVYNGFQQELETNETILGGAPFGNSFLIYTDKRIWEAYIGLASDGVTIAVLFRVAYDATENEMKGTLAYSGILVQTTEGHIYGGHDGLYLFNPLSTRPERPEWLHRTTPLIYDNIDRQACDVHCAAIFGDEILVSVAETGQANKCPNVTLRINWTYRTCDKVDVGMTAMNSYNSQNVQTVRDFIVENRICTLTGLLALDANLHLAYTNEGLPNPLPVGSAAFEPMSIHTLDPYQFDGTLTVASAGTAAANGSFVWSSANKRYEKSANGYYIVRESRVWKLKTDAAVVLYSNPTTVLGTWATVVGGAGPAPGVTGSNVVTVEDFEKLDNDADSLCALLDGELIDAGCRGCKGDTLLVVASSADWCLKQLGEVFYRETCANPAAVGSTTANGYQSAAGSYVFDGITSLFVPSPTFASGIEIHATRAQVDYEAVAQTPPSEMSLRIGISGQIADPNDPKCRIVWRQLSSKAIKCDTTQTEAVLQKANLNPAGQPLAWKFDYRGVFMYFEFKITGTGGDSTYSRLTSMLEGRPIQRIV